MKSESTSIRTIGIFLCTLLFISTFGFLTVQYMAREELQSNLHTVESSEFTNDVYEKRPQTEYSLPSHPLDASGLGLRGHEPRETLLRVGEILSDDNYQNLLQSNDEYTIISPADSEMNIRTHDKYFMFNFDIFSAIGMNPYRGLERDEDGEYYFPFQFAEPLSGLINVSWFTIGWNLTGRDIPVSQSFLDSISTIWALYEIYPDESTLLSYDELTNASVPYETVGRIADIEARFSPRKHSYLASYENNYYEFTMDGGTDSSMSFEVSCGGLRLRNDSLYNLYNIISNAVEKRIEYYGDSFTILDIILQLADQYLFKSNQDILPAFVELSLLLWLEQNPSFVDYFRTQLNTYEDFLDYLDIDLNEGYLGSVSVIPYAITEIEGVTNVYIERDPDDPTMPEVTNYSVQAWNYYANQWVTIFHREDNSPSMPITNQWFQDEWIIANNPWQYLMHHDEDEGFIRYRVVVNTEGDETQDGDINVRFGGLWSSFQQTFVDMVFEMDFSIDDQNIYREDLYSDPVFEIEYHTRGMTDIYDNIQVVQPMDYILDIYYNFVGELQYTEDIMDSLFEVFFEYGFEVFVDFFFGDGELGEEVVSDLLAEFLSDTLNTFEFTSIGSGVRLQTSHYDIQRSVPIPRNMIRGDASIPLALYARCSYYDANGNPRTHFPQIYIDKISMNYQYEAQVPIESTMHFSRNDPMYFYTSFEMDIPHGVNSLEFQIPINYEFINEHDRFGLVESPDMTDISHYWKDGISFYDGRNIKVDPYVLIFEGYGRYTFWFRTRNYVDEIQMINSTGGIYERFDQLLMNQSTTYQLFLNTFGHSPTIIRDEWRGGTVEMIMYGSNFRGTERVTLNIDDLTAKRSSYEYYCDEEDVYFPYTNLYEFDYTHYFEDDIWGEITILLIWRSETQKHMGFAETSVHLPPEELAAPLITIDSPQPNDRWGANQINYAQIRSYHPSTTEVNITFTETGDTFSLINLEEYLESPESYEHITLPLHLTDVSENTRHWYWFYPINGSYFSNHYELTEQTVPIDTMIQAKSMVGGVSYPIDPIEYTFQMVSELDFQVSPMLDLIRNQRPVVRYECPPNIQTINIGLYTFEDLDPIPLVTIGDGSPSIYLIEGARSYIVPFRLENIGNYRLIIEVEDDVGNMKTIITNEFTVTEEDTRQWYMRVLDEGFEMMTVWTSLTLSSGGLGTIVINQRAKKQHENGGNTHVYDDIK